MKIFDFKNPRHIQILREEIQRAKRILQEDYRYSTDEIWDVMSQDEREKLLLSSFDNEGPELAKQYADISVTWDQVPAEVQDRLDLSDYKLAKHDIVGGGSTRLRAIENFMKQDPDVVKLVNAYVKKIQRKDVRSITWIQSHDLLMAVHDLINAKNPRKPMTAGGDAIGAMIQMDKEAGRKYYGGD